MSHLIINSPNKNKFALVSDQAQVKLEQYTFIIIENSVISNGKINLFITTESQEKEQETTTPSGEEAKSQKLLSRSLHL